MSNCTHIQSLLSEYDDRNSLSGKDRAIVDEHLGSCSHCYEFDQSLKQTVYLLNQVPMPSPRLDLWQEFEPKMAEIEAESHLAPIARMRRAWQHFAAHVAEGMVVYTQIVAHRTLTKMEKYLIHDPFRISE